MVQLFITLTMYITSGSVLLLSFLLLFRKVVCQGQWSELENCRRSNLPTYSCQKWNECAKGKEIIQQGRAILCGFENSVAKICCPPVTVIRPTPPQWTTQSTTRTTTTTTRRTTPTTTRRATSPITTTTRTTTPTNRRNAVAIAERKCIEYGRHRFVNATIPGQFIGEPDTFYDKTDCVNVQELIVGGTQAAPKEFPHMALIGYGNSVDSVEWLCGGSLISERFVLSAAHCSSSGSREAKWVLLGDLNFNSQTDEAKPRIYKIIRRIDHPGYRRNAEAYNDISLFQLNTTVEFSPFVRPICLYTSTSTPTTDKKVSVTGWGVTGTIELRSDHLLKATIYFVDDNKCQASYGTDSNFPRGYDANSMVCAGDILHGKDTCSGDSGGPLQLPIKDTFCMWTQVGVTSIGPSLCGNMETPAIYTKVANYIEWIQPIVWP